MPKRSTARAAAVVAGLVAAAGIVQDALDALASGRSALVDVAEVDGTVFVNNASIGVYGDLVRRRERLERHMPKRIALLIAAVRTMTSAEPLEIEVDGRHERAFLVFVGNNAYSGLGLTGRSSLQAGLLDVRVLRARGPVPVLGVLARIIIGWLPRSQWLRQSLRREVVVRVPEGTLLAHDGEIEEASGELRFSSRPGAVRVLVGPSAG